MNAQPKPPKTVRKSKHISNNPIPDGSECWACGSARSLETHEMFGGPDRNKSIKYGLQVILCKNCHTGRDGVHGKDGLILKTYTHEMGQKRFEQNHTRDEFIKVFGRSYL